MEYVEALRNKKDINAIKRYLKKQSERDYVLFMLGINTGLKITELLSIQVKDVFEDGVIHRFLNMTSEKYQIYLNEQVRKLLHQYIQIASLEKEDYLFLSKKTSKPITRQQAYRIIHQAAEQVGIKGKIGTNSMRKTFGYHAYKQGVAISILQKHFHHSCPSETLKYLGISKNENIRTEVDVRL